MLRAELADRDTVPRTRYDACNQDWLDSKRELEHVREVAEAEIDKLKVEVERRDKKEADQKIECDRIAREITAEILTEGVGR